MTSTKKQEVKRVNMADVVKAIADANTAYSKREKLAYEKVAAVIDKLNKTVTAYNNTIAHDKWEEVGVSVKGFAETARHDKLTVNLDRESGTFKTNTVKAVYSLDSFAAWHGLDGVKVLPDGFKDTVKFAMANLAGMVARMASDVNTDAEIERINNEYKTDVRGSKNDAKHALQAMVDTILPGYKVTGSDLNKVMFGCFKVNTTNWKITLPREDTLIKVFSGLLAAMVNGQDVNEIFEWPVKKTEDAAK